MNNWSEPTYEPWVTEKSWNRHKSRILSKSTSSSLNFLINININKDKLLGIVKLLVNVNPLLRRP